MDEITGYIREQLPDLKDSIDLLVAKDQEFRVLCDDYDACVDAFRYWISSEDAGAEDRISEYRGLISALYEEIIQILIKNSKRSQK